VYKGMTILVIADDDGVADAVPGRGYDVLVACGDLHDQTILKVARKVGCSRILAVKGNHDDATPYDPRITDLHRKTVETRRTASIRGSPRLRPTSASASPWLFCTAISTEASEPPRKDPGNRGLRVSRAGTGCDQVHVEPHALGLDGPASSPGPPRAEGGEGFSLGRASCAGLEGEPALQVWRCRT
jgi:hypothetical protein